MTIPTYIEQLILQGKGQMQTVTHNADRFIISAPKGSYVILFGFQIHAPFFDPEYVIDNKGANYSIQVAADEKVNFYQYKIADIESNKSRAIDNACDFPAYLITENDVFFQIMRFSYESGTSAVDFRVSDLDVSNAAPVSFLPSPLGTYPPGQDYLVSSQYPFYSPPLFNYLPFGAEFTNRFFPGFFPAGAQGYNSWTLSPLDLGNPLYYENTYYFQEERDWTSVLGITVHYFVSNEQLPTRTNGKFII